MRIVVFGDSIAEGFWDYETGGWVNMLKVYLWKKYSYDYMVMNYGISSYTSDNILKFFQPFFDGCSRRELGKKKSAVIVAIGINDEAMIKETRLPRVDEEKFTQNIHEIIQKYRNDNLI